MESKKQIMDQLLADHQIFHSEFQISEFIINGDACGNVYGMYKQCVRELNVRKKTLRQYYIDRERKMLDLVDIQSQATRPMGKREKSLEHLTLDARELEMALEELQLTITDTEREFQQFFNHAVQLKAKVGDTTGNRREELDREMWEHRVKVMAALDLLTLGRFQEHTFRMINSFPSNKREGLTAWMKDRSRVRDWFASLPSIEEVIDINAIDYVNPSKMIE